MVKVHHESGGFRDVYAQFQVQLLAKVNGLHQRFSAQWGISINVEKIIIHPMVLKHFLVFLKKTAIKIRWISLNRLFRHTCCYLVETVQALYKFASRVLKICLYGVMVNKEGICG